MYWMYTIWSFRHFFLVISCVSVYFRLGGNFSPAEFIRTSQGMVCMGSYLEGNACCLASTEPLPFKVFLCSVTSIFCLQSQRKETREIVCLVVRMMKTYIGVPHKGQQKCSWRSPEERAELWLAGNLLSAEQSLALPHSISGEGLAPLLPAVQFAGNLPNSSSNQYTTSSDKLLTGPQTCVVRMLLLR